MNKVTFLERTTQNYDWAIVVIIFIILLIAVVKTNFENRYSDYMRLFISDKYIKIYKDGSLIMSWFTVILFVVQIFSFSFFLLLILDYYDIHSKYDGIIFVQIFTFLFVFILAKFLIEKIIATAFDIEDFVDQFNMQKVSYRTYISMLLLPINIFLFYNNYLNKTVYLILIITILFLNVVNYTKSIKTFQKLVFKNLLYFILYLCTLEIAPYYFIYHWFIER